MKTARCFAENVTGEKEEDSRKNDIKREPGVFGFPSNCNLRKKTRKLEGYQLTLGNETWALVVFDKASRCCSLGGFAFITVHHVSSKKKT